LKKTKTRKNNFDKKWDYWENFLKTYEEKKILIPLEVVKPSYEFYKLEKNFTLYESAEILVDEMLKQQTNRDTILSLIEVEKILASCLFFKEEGNNEKIKKILDPINQLIELCNKPVNIYKESYPKEFNHNVAFMSLIAYVWQNNGNTLETPKNSPLESAYKSLYNDRKELFIDFVHYFKVKEIKTFLATPTHENGWVSPDIFIERLNAFKQENISISDFMKVLYKIPTIKEEHNKIWQAFENKLENFNKIISSALKIAFAPENIFNQEKNNLINHFTNNPPNACIAWDYYNTKPEIDNNTLAFYIFCASLRCRYGLEDLSQEIPELISKELTKNFTIKVGRHRNFEKDTFEKKIPFLKLFYHPEELSKSKKNSDGTFTTYFELYQRNPEDSMHYQFYGSFFYVPHLIAYGANLDNESSYPPIKQRLFERSVIYLTKFASRTTGTTTHLKKMGSPSYVNILPFIEDIIYPHKFSEHRNDIIELITTALFDGRITHEILAKTFAKKFELNDGSQYLDYLLEGLANFSSACKFITIYILEYLICNSFDKVTPKTSSIILDRYYNLLEANKIKPTTIEVLNRLELLAKGKKSVTKEKAQLLLLLEGSLNNLLEVEIVKSLVEES
jgi:hypothetical protein